MLYYKDSRTTSERTGGEEVVNVNKLKGKIVENQLTLGELAIRIGIDRSTLYRKIANHGEDFSIKEADLISRELKLTEHEAMEIFFTNYVAPSAKDGQSNIHA